MDTLRCNLVPKNISIKPLRNLLFFFFLSFFFFFLLFFIKQWKIVFPQNCLKVSGAGFRNIALSGCLIITFTPYNMSWFLILFSGINTNKRYL